MKRNTFELPDSKWLTSRPASGDCSAVLPEFGRWQEVQRLFGIKRGVLYRKIADGTIKSISLREPGKKFGCRLIHLESVRAWLNSLLKTETAAPKAQSKLGRRFNGSAPRPRHRANQGNYTSVHLDSADLANEQRQQKQ